MTQPIEAEADIQGWYHLNATSEAVRVRLSIEPRLILLHTLSGRLVASWAQAHLETRAIETIGERWTIGDTRLPEAFLVLESDRDYTAIREISARLRPVRSRFWQQIGFSAIESGNMTGWPVLLLVIAVPAIVWLWNNLPLTYCIATHQDTTLFLKCLIVDHFIP